ncbi:MAG: right-handed parallel beta-helix repeat-containing protein [Verrucomicrobia bacterium]|nr:right-handed parallel beta-helix repeat-containing protein [Verrucomicrobiota bacterium]MCG2679273.1 right-handed parallel beta-helix repeat-containing protein [Kiritimatiellia bacterium]MBU4247751.1 right-handed parallel beta-helix repeat-containing protein [Verrucomicrobiota bacterium]MBU4290958.1 right-handed parallel beta-helix repeat-containing protein [Verrucomicrobiota bacterium]MBU4430293.1 right-handed parallel beta-helix repeat-containing protein [Verrucomicrobiota bacterium]
MKNPGFIIFQAITLLTAQSVCAIVYVDAGYGGGGNDGSAGTPFTNIQAGVNLAGLSADTVYVAQGTYLEQVTISNGSCSVRGCFGGVGNWAQDFKLYPTIIDASGQSYGFYIINSIDNVLIEGFSVKSATSCGIRFASGNVGNMVRFCNVLLNARGIVSGNGAGYVSIVSCSIVWNTYSGVITEWNSGSTAALTNCIVAFNGGYGVAPSEWDASHRIYAAYCSFYGNGLGNWSDGVRNRRPVYNTAAQINSRSGNSNNIVANPGYAEIQTSWDLRKLYADSLCLGAGRNGVTLGAYTNADVLSVSSNTYYVSNAGNDTNSGALSSPWASVRKAATVAQGADQVIVMPGIYAGDIVLQVGGSAATPVTYKGQGQVVITNGTNCLRLKNVAGVAIEGFQFRGATTAGIIFDNAKCVTVLNGSSYSNSGYGIYFSGSHLNIVNNLDIYGSSGGYGIYFASANSNTVEQCKIHHNGQPGIYVTGSIAEGGYDQTASLTFDTIQNCAIYCNNVGIAAEGAWCNTSGILVKNCTITTNTGTGIDMRWSCANITFARNCIISHNTGWGITTAGSDDDVNLAYCNLYSNKLGNTRYEGVYTNNTAAEINAFSGAVNTNNIVKDPMFRKFDQYNFHLWPYSPCINAGDPSDPVPAGGGSIIDIGAYECTVARGTFISICSRNDLRTSRYANLALKPKSRENNPLR